jgi:hypothetical protein
MPIAEPPTLNRVAAALSEYLEANPDACDDIQGVLDWWLRSAGIAAPRDVAEEALRMLGNDGRVLIRRSLSGKVLYSGGPRR